MKAVRRQSSTASSPLVSLVIMGGVGLVADNVAAMFQKTSEGYITPPAALIAADQRSRRLRALPIPLRARPGRRPQAAFAARMRAQPDSQIWRRLP